MYAHEVSVWVGISFSVLKCVREQSTLLDDLKCWAAFRLTVQKGQESGVRGSLSNRGSVYCSKFVLSYVV